jgi:ABC-2 type transport system permease protein
MKWFFALITARSKEFYRDRATLSWTLLFPLIVMLGFSFGYSGKDAPLLRVGILQSELKEEPELKELLALPQIETILYSDSELARKRIERHQLDLLIERSEPSAPITLSINPDSTKKELIEKLIPPGKFSRQALRGKKLRYVDWLVPGLISMNLMFGSLYGVGYVIVRYRKNGVLKRFRATPLTAFGFLISQLFSRLLLMMITATITVFCAQFLIGFHVAGSFLSFYAVVAIGSSAMMGLGLLVASRMSSEEMADGVLNLMTWPMLFLSGIWFSLDGASPWVVRLSHLMPMTAVVDGLRAVLIDGMSVVTLIPSMAGLMLTTVVLLGIGSLIFKWR